MKIQHILKYFVPVMVKVRIKGLFFSSLPSVIKDPFTLNKIWHGDKKVENKDYFTLSGIQCDERKLIWKDSALT